MFNIRRLCLIGVLILAGLGGCRTKASFPADSSGKAAAPASAASSGAEGEGVFRPSGAGDGGFAEAVREEKAADGAGELVSLSFSEPVVLGEDPLCEASAALRPNLDPERILVADNEHRRGLFAFSFKDGLLVNPVELPLPKKGPRDIEALAQLEDQILVVGSFSRNSSCEQRPNRARMMWLSSDGKEGLKLRTRIDGADALASLAQVEQCMQRLFENPPPSGALEVCEALAAAETSAIESEGKRCDTLNIEAAVAVWGSADAGDGKVAEATVKKGRGAGGAELQAADSGRIWLGLRSPLVQGKAVLLRMSQGHDEFRFDRVLLADLQGKGFRALDSHKDEIIGIAGPPGSGKDFKLISFSTRHLVEAPRADSPGAEKQRAKTSSVTDSQAEVLQPENSQKSAVAHFNQAVNVSAGDVQTKDSLGVPQAGAQRLGEPGQEKSVSKDSRSRNSVPQERSAAEPQSLELPILAMELPVLESSLISIRSTLPRSSEGLAVLQGHLMVVIDGKEGEKGVCSRPSLQSSAKWR